MSTRPCAERTSPPAGLPALREVEDRSAGGKAAPLAALIRAGLPVPDGFVVPTEEFRRASRMHPSAARDDVRGGVSVPRDLMPRVERALARLLGTPDGGWVAVRSSSTHEDVQGSSAAGQHDTVLAVRGVSAVCAAIAQCWSSLGTARATAYRASRDIAAGRAGPDDAAHDDVAPAMAVLIQSFVDADVSGVLFTGEEELVLEAAWGLGETLVGGLITPSSWTMRGDAIVGRRRGAQPERADRVGDHVAVTALPQEIGGSFCLSDAQVREVSRLGRRAARMLADGLDIEWAIQGDQVHLLQARPITAPLPASPPQSSPCAAPVVPTAPARIELRGLAAGPGIASGPAKVVHDPADVAHVRPGDVLVCEHTDPAWTPLFRMAAAVVTENGGLLSHAAIVAREMGIPAVLAVPDATRILAGLGMLGVDGDAGIVTCRRA